MAQAGAVVANNDLFSTDDPVKLFELTEEIATGSYGAVYKVRPRYFRCAVIGSC